MNHVMRSRRRIVLTILAGALLALFGCGEPSEQIRQNRRLLDAVLTAVTTKNRKELDQDAALWDKRLADGVLSEKSHKTVQACIEKARSGDWSGAETDLYKFRDSHPFPR